MVKVTPKECIDYIKLRMFMIPGDITSYFMHDYEVRTKTSYDAVLDLVEFTLEDLPNVYDYEKATPWYYGGYSKKAIPSWYKATDVKRAEDHARSKAELGCKQFDS